MGNVTLYQDDNRNILRQLIAEGVRVHSVVCDPPYGLVSVTKRFGGEGAAPAKHGRDGAFARQSAGFMGSKWDGTGIERDPEFWRLVHDILLPGGYVLAFSSPRTGHWQACAMELAGFIMHPFLGWLYGQGLPKAHSAAMAIDQALGVKGTRGDPKAGFEDYIGKDNTKGLREGTVGQPGGFARPWMSDPDAVDASHRRYIPASIEAALWDGWAYGAQTLKPALEPIYMGQRPFDQKNGGLNMLSHGVGAINIDGCRVDRPGGRYREGEPSQDRLYGERGSTSFGGRPGPRGGSPDGGFPANLLHDGSPEVVALFPNSPGQLADATQRVHREASENGIYSATAHHGNRPKRVATTTAAEFFNSFEIPICPACAGDGSLLDTDVGLWVDCLTCSGAGYLNVDPVIYHKKANKLDRAGSRHPTVKPVTMIRWLCRLVTPIGGTILDPFAGSGTTGAAAREEGFDTILIEADARYAMDIRNRFNIELPSDIELLI